jgi:hypothetical protein
MKPNSWYVSTFLGKLSMIPKLNLWTSRAEETHCGRPQKTSLSVGRPVDRTTRKTFARRVPELRNQFRFLYLFNFHKRFLTVLQIDNRQRTVTWR